MSDEKKIELHEAIPFVFCRDFYVHKASSSRKVVKFLPFGRFWPGSFCNPKSRAELAAGAAVLEVDRFVYIGAIENLVV